MASASTPETRRAPPLARRVRWAFLCCTLLLVPLTAWIVLSWTEHVILDNLDRQLEETARVLAAAWDIAPETSGEGGTLPQGRRLATRPDLPLRVTVVARDGRVIADSARAPEQMENHLQRPEIQEALAGRVGHNSHRSRTLGREMRYLAVPVRDGALRIAIPSENVESEIAALRERFFAAFLVVLLLGLIVAEAAARYIAAPLSRLEANVREARLADDVPEEGPAEVLAVAHALNQARSELRAQYRELADEHARLEAILGSIEEGVVLSDASGRVLFVNPPAAQKLAIDETALIGWRFAERYDGYAPSRVLERLSNESEETEELRLPEHDRTLTLRTRSLRAADGTVTLRMALLRDVSEYVRIERLRREFVANASHELRTPVAAAAAALEAVEMAADDPAMRDEFLARAQAEIDTLRQLAESLLDLSAAEEREGSGEIAAAPIADVDEAVGEVVDSMRPLAAQRGQRIVVTAGGPARVGLSPLELARVVRNLLDNAIKYSPEGGEIAVRTRIVEKPASHAMPQAGDTAAKETAVAATDAKTQARDAGTTDGTSRGTVSIDVTDTGAGIPPAQLQRVFERFFRLDRARTGGTGGTGLGLSIARHLVERRGGRLEAANIPEGGARFTVTLPMAK